MIIEPVQPKELARGLAAGLLAALSMALTIIIAVMLMGLLTGCGPQPGPAFVVDEVGGEGFVEGAAWGQPFVFEVRASGIADEQGELVDCVVILIQWQPYLDVAGVPYDAPLACVDEYGALPGFFRDSPDSTGPNGATPTD